jgi:hypothetical protein
MRINFYNSLRVLKHSMINPKPVWKRISGRRLHRIGTRSLNVVKIDAIELMNGPLICGKSLNFVYVFGIKLGINLIVLGVTDIGYIALVSPLSDHFLRVY